MFVKFEHDSLLKFIAKFNGVNNKHLIASLLVSSMAVKIPYVEVLLCESPRDHVFFENLSDCKFYESDPDTISMIFMSKMSSILRLCSSLIGRSDAFHLRTKVLNAMWHILCRHDAILISKQFIDGKKLKRPVAEALRHCFIKLTVLKSIVYMLRIFHSTAKRHLKIVDLFSRVPVKTGIETADHEVNNLCYMWVCPDSNWTYVGKTIQGYNNRFLQHVRGVCKHDSTSQPWHKLLCPLELSRYVMIPIVFVACTNNVQLMGLESDLCAVTRPNLNWPAVAKLISKKSDVKDPGVKIIEFNKSSIVSSDLTAMVKCNGGTRKRPFRRRADARKVCYSEEFPLKCFDVKGVDISTVYKFRSVSLLAKMLADPDPKGWKLVGAVRMLVRNRGHQYAAFLHKRIQKYVSKSWQSLAFSRLQSALVVKLSDLCMPAFNVHLPYVRGADVKSFFMNEFVTPAVTQSSQVHKRAVRLMKSRPLSFKKFFNNSKMWARKIDTEDFDCTCRELSHLLQHPLPESDGHFCAKLSDTSLMQWLPQNFHADTNIVPIRAARFLPSTRGDMS